MTSHFDVAAVRAQRKAAAIGLAYDFRPVPVQLETRDTCSFVDLDCHAAASYGDAFVICGVPVYIAERTIQYGHFEAGEWQDRPRAENQEKPGCDSERNSQYETEGEQSS